MGARPPESLDVHLLNGAGHQIPVRGGWRLAGLRQTHEWRRAKDSGPTLMVCHQGHHAGGLREPERDLFSILSEMRRCETSWPPQENMATNWPLSLPATHSRSSVRPAPMRPVNADDFTGLDRKERDDRRHCSHHPTAGTVRSSIDKSGFSPMFVAGGAASRGRSFSPTMVGVRSIRDQCPCAGA